MFSRSAIYYDAIYSFKDYAAEADKVRTVIAQYKRIPGDSLLDVACGTGRHLENLHAHFQVEGLDLDPDLLAIARARLPDVPLHQGDMLDFDLGRSFDAITCLFSGIGYVGTVDRLSQAISTMAGHLRPGGVLIVEPWFEPAAFHPNTLHAAFIDQPDLKIARLNLSRVENGLSVLDFHYLVGTPEGIEHFSERHELGLFTSEEMLTAFARAGLQTSVDPDGLTGRGLYIGVRPTD